MQNITIIKSPLTGGEFAFQLLFFKVGEQKPFFAVSVEGSPEVSPITGDSFYNGVVTTVTDVTLIDTTNNK